MKNFLGFGQAEERKPSKKSNDSIVAAAANVAYDIAHDSGLKNSDESSQSSSKGRASILSTLTSGWSTGISLGTGAKKDSSSHSASLEKVDEEASGDDDSSAGASFSEENHDVAENVSEEDEDSDDSGFESEEDVEVSSRKASVTDNNSAGSSSSTRKSSPTEKKDAALAQEFNSIKIDEEEDKSSSHAGSAGKGSSISSSAGSENVSMEKPAKRGSLFAFTNPFAAFSSGKAAKENPSQSPKKKTEVELGEERLQQIYQAQQEEEIALAAEPKEAKYLRRTFDTLDSVLRLFDGVFYGSRFLPVGHGLLESRGLLDAEIDGDEEKIGLLKFFEDMIVPEKATSIFENLKAWQIYFETLSNNWTKVFCYYVKPIAEHYSFSLMPIFILSVYHKALEAFIKLKYKDEFHGYMRTSVLLSAEENSIIVKFSEILEQFSARMFVLYRILDALKQNIEEFPKNTQDFNWGYEEKVNIDTDFTDALDLAQEEFDEVFAKMDDASKAMAVYKAQLEEHDNQDDIAGNKEALILLFDKAKSQVDAIRPQLEVAKNNLEQARGDVVKARKDAETDLATKKLLLKNNEENLVTSQKTAYQDMMSFLVEYLARSIAQTTFMVSQPIQIQAPLYDISLTMLNAWLRDQDNFLSPKDRDVVLDLFQIHVRELTMTLEITAGNLEIRLKDNEHKLLEDFFIAVNGPARDTLLPSFNAQAVSEKINAEYSKLVNANTMSNMANDVATSNSDKSERATNLMLAIRRSRIEHNQSPNQLALVLFGVYLLLYLKNGPKNREFLNGTSFRFMTALVQVVEKEYGYNLPAAKEIYDAMQVQSAKASTPIEEIVTIASSLLSRKRSATDDMSTVIDYILSPARTVDELSTDKKYPYKKIKSLSPKKSEDLVQELQHARYLPELERLINIDEIEEIDRKRIKRIVELLNMLALPYRLELVKSFIIKLLVVRNELLDLPRKYHNVKSSKMGNLLAGVKGRADSMIEKMSAKENSLLERFIFLDTLFNRFKLMYLDSQTVETVTLPDMLFFDVFKKMHKDQELDAKTLQNLVDKNISGKDSEVIVKIFGWFMNEELEYIFRAAPTDIASLRKRNGDTMEQFDTVIVARDVNSHTFNVQQANEMFILLACQTAVLRFHKEMQSTGNQKMIVLASQHSWFLQLRFLEAILVKKHMLPKYDQDQTASVNRTLERKMLTIFDKMIKNIEQLPELIVNCFSSAQGRADLMGTISKKSDDEKTKGAFLLIVEFFAILFSVQGETVLHSDSDYGKFLLTLSGHFKDIAQIMGVELEKKHRAVIFAMAVYFISINQSALLSDTCISIQDAHEPPRGEIAGLIKHSGKLDTAFYFSASSVKVIRDNDQQVATIFSDRGTAFFANSVEFNDPAEQTLYVCAKHDMKR